MRTQRKWSEKDERENRIKKMEGKECDKGERWVKKQREGE